MYPKFTTRKGSGKGRAFNYTRKIFVEFPKLLTCDESWICIISIRQLNPWWINEILNLSPSLRRNVASFAFHMVMTGQNTFFWIFLKKLRSLGAVEKTAYSKDFKTFRGEINRQFDSQVKRPHQPVQIRPSLTHWWVTHWKQWELNNYLFESLTQFITTREE